MHDPLSVTFRILRESQHPDVSDLLAHGVEVEHVPVAQAAARTILRRGQNRELVELLKELPQRPSCVLEILNENPAIVDAAFRHGIKQGGTEVALRLMKSAQFLDRWQLCPVFLATTQSSAGPVAEEASELLLLFADRIYDLLRSSNTPQNDRTRLRPLVESLLLDLAAIFNKPDKVVYAERLVEVALILGRLTHVAVRLALWQGSQQLREISSRLLMSSRHPAIMQQVLDSLCQNYPHPKVFEVLRDRDDLEFICHLLRHLPTPMPSLMAQNLRQMTMVCWLPNFEEVIRQLPPDLQPALLTFAQSLRIPRELKSRLEEWLLRHGAPAGRSAATASSSVLDEELFQDVVLEGLDSEDSAVQAWATTQLRQLKIPEAYQLLVERLDSLVPQVRNAAVKELSGFTVERVLSLMDRLDDSAALRAGHLLVKVDPEAIPKLRREFASPVRQRRLRAAQSALKLGLTTELATGFFALAQDSDPMLRRAAVEGLLQLDTPAARQTLESLRHDSSQRVRSVLSDVNFESSRGANL